MKDGIILFILFCAAGIIFFFGVVFLFKKSIQAVPKVEPNKEYQQLLTDQKIRSKETLQRQRRLMRDQQQRIKDFQRR